MNKLEPNKGIKVFDITWSTDTAGPSPYENKRTELFLLGCKRAEEGIPCKGCFNSVIWDSSKALHSWDPKELADKINTLAPNKYITISGGEPTDQVDNLIILCKELKKYGFHIMMYTWLNLDFITGPVPIYTINHPINYEMETIRNRKYKIKELLRFLDIIVDGQFNQEEKMYQQYMGDGLLSSIGSGNQRIWDIKHYNDILDNPSHHYPMIDAIMPVYYMRDLVGLYIKPDTNDLIYITKE